MQVPLGDSGYQRNYLLSKDSFWDLRPVAFAKFERIQLINLGDRLDIEEVVIWRAVENIGETFFIIANLLLDSVEIVFYEGFQ